MSDDSTSDAQPTARRKPARRIPDLDAVFAAVDEKPGEPRSMPAGFLDLVQAATETPPAGPAVETPPKPARKKKKSKAATGSVAKTPAKPARQKAKPKAAPAPGAKVLDISLPAAAPELTPESSSPAAVNPPPVEAAAPASSREAPAQSANLPEDGLANLLPRAALDSRAALNTRAARKKVDLNSLFDAPSPPSTATPPPEAAPAPRARTGRGRPDLGALFDEVDQRAEGRKPEKAGAGFLDFASPELAPPTLAQAVQPDSAPPAAVAPSPAPETAEARPRRRDKAELFSLLGGQETTQSAGRQVAGRQPASLDAPRIATRAAPLFDLSRPAEATDEVEGAEETQLPIPAELHTYVSADLWRKLNSPVMPRGALFNALERVRSVLYLLSTFLPTHLVQEKMRRPVAGLTNGQLLQGSLLFSDVSGFTPLSERLAVLGPQGAERVTAIMNQYFATMLEIQAWSGGVLLKFAGDAMLIYFPQQENGEHINWAVRAGQRMLRAMKNFSRIETPQGPQALQMKVGLATGEFLAASVGSEKRMEYFVMGPAVTQTMTAEGKTTGGGQLVVNAQSAEALGKTFDLTDLADGFYLLRQKPADPQEEEKTLDDFEIKADARRARGAIPWNAGPRAILAQIEVAVRQIQAIQPYLSPELVERIVVHARQRQVESEYRPTTTLFGNFTGLETLLELWGPAGAPRVTSILNAYFASMYEVVARYGGIISRVDPYSKGTKMLILFGAPVAHEDDPQRAVSAALAMNAELEVLDEGWRRKFARYLPADWNMPLLQHRLGITFGETFAGQVGSSTRREYTVMGDEVNLAARLMSVAEMGQILIEQKVQKVVADYFVLSPLPPMRVKGKSKPVAVFQVDGPRDDTLARRAHSRGSLVGRSAEMAQARQVLQQALQGQGALLTITGPAGIGKSHLADELVNRASDQGAQALFVQCRAYNAETPYAVWGIFLRSLAGITSIDYNPKVHYNRLLNLLRKFDLSLFLLQPLAKLMGLNSAVFQEAANDNNPDAAETALGQPPASGDDFSFVRGGRAKRRGSSLDLFQEIEKQQVSDAGQVWQQLSAQLGERERQEYYNAVWDLLSGLARLRPMVIFFEDAQWIDGPSRDLLRFLEPRLAQIPALILMTCRGAAPGCAGNENAPIGQTVELGPLNQSNTTALVAHILVSDLAQVIYEHTDGNPMFVDEITRWFKRTRNINAEELRSVMQSSNILQKLVLSGLEGLPEIQREIMRVATVIGVDEAAEFRTGEVQAMLHTAIDAVSLSEHLRRLVKEKLLSLAEAGADARYTFQQPLVRDILYNSLPYEQRRDLHARLAEYLSNAPSRRRRVQARIAAALDFGPSNPAQESEGIAYHFEQADRWLDAARFRLEAGKQAWALQTDFGAEKALDNYSRALVCLEKASTQEAPQAAQTLNALKYAAALGKGDLAALSGQYLAATSAYEIAQAALLTGMEGGSAADAIRAAYKLALMLPTQNRAADALKTLQQAFKQQAEAGIHENLAAVGVLAWLLWRAGKNDAPQWIERGRELAAPASSDWMAGVKALLAELAGDWQTAQDAYLAQNNITGAALTALRCGDWRAERKEAHQALACYRQAADLWRVQSPAILVREKGSPLASVEGSPLISVEGSPLSVVEGSFEARPDSRFEKMNGLALAFYQQAGVYWQMHDLEATQHALEEALAALPQCAAPLQVGGRVAIPRALKTIAQKSRARRLPVWRWQAYDDIFRISILLEV